MSKESVKFISVEEAAQRVVDAVPEVVSFEISSGSLRLNFDRSRRISGTDVFTRTTTFSISETMVPEWTVTDVIQRLRAMFDNPVTSSDSNTFKKSKIRKPKQR